MRKKSAAGAPASPQTIFLTSGTSWTVPVDWNPAYNTIEVIGGGGGGDEGAAGGGGGGAYSKVYNVSLTPGTTVTYSIGVGGSGGVNGSSSSTAGGDTWFCNSNTNCGSIAGSSVIVGAKGGARGMNSGQAGGVGGSAAAGIGSLKYSGGQGGNSANNQGGGGGGGAAGPNGPGASGGATSTARGGGGGGGSGGSVGAASTGSAGGAGGAGFSGSGAGLGATSTSHATAGTAGGGGGGGYNGGTYQNGGAGGHGTDWDATHGAGGGGGGGGRTTGKGGGGGLYGAGGGGYESGTGSTAGAGAQGLIVIRYGPSPTVVSTPTTLNACGFGGITLSNGNRTVTDSAVNASTYAQHSMNSGKWYFEVTLTDYTQSFMGVTCGAGASLCTYRPSYITPMGGISVMGATIDSYDGVTSGAYTIPYSSGDVAHFAVDFTAGKIWVGAKGQWFGNGNPAAGSAPFTTFTPGANCWIGLDWSNNSATASSATLNAGQSPMLFGPPAGFSSGWGVP